MPDTPENRPRDDDIEPDLVEVDVDLDEQLPGSPAEPQPPAASPAQPASAPPGAVQPAPVQAAAQATAQPAPAQLVEPQPAPMQPPASQPAPVQPGETQPAAQPAPAQPAAEDVAVSDSVEEVLQQASDQALRLSHLEDLVSGVGQNLGDLQEEMHAGFAEMRALAEQAPQQASHDAAGEAFRRKAIERLDHLDLQLVRARRRQGLLVFLAVLQMLLVGALGGYIYWSQEHAEPTFSAVPAYTAPAAVEQPPEDPAAQTPAPEERKPAKRGRRKRR